MADLTCTGGYLTQLNFALISALISTSCCGRKSILAPLSTTFLGLVVGYSAQSNMVHAQTQLSNGSSGPGP